MTPTFLEKMSLEIAEVYGAVTDQILINLAKYFPYIKEGKEPKSVFEYQVRMLAQMGKVNRETIKIIRDNLKDADDALKKVLEQTIISTIQKVEPDLVNAAQAGLLQTQGFTQPVVAPNQMRAFQAYYKQAAERFNLVNTVMLESTEQAYKETVANVGNQVQMMQLALDTGAAETITGASTWNQALRHSIDALKKRGITGFVDHAGRHWSAEAYVAMDIRTTVFNTGRSAVWETNQSFGNDLYLVSYHNGARPLCYPWQNKVISSTNNSRDVEDLDGNKIHVYAQSETSYGEPAGLFGINCKHYPTPFIPGVSTIRGKPPDEEENEKEYEESQKQRALERKLREENRDLMMLRARGAPEEEIAAQVAKCRKTSAEIEDFCDETGRARHREREVAYTKRSFPSKETYDAATFVKDQKEIVDKFFKNGGSQQKYIFGDMVRPEGEQQVLRKFKRYQPNTKTEAEKTKQVNPNYYEKGTLAWTYNCQRCVVAQEMIYRGYNVTAKAYDRTDPIGDSGIAVWNYNGRTFWDDPNVRISHKRSDFAKLVNDSFDEWGEGSRGILRIKWDTKHGGNGHFLYAIKTNDGVHITDPQKNIDVDLTEALKNVTISTDSLWVMRVDNRGVNDKIKYAIKNVVE